MEENNEVIEKRDYIIDFIKKHDSEIYIFKCVTFYVNICFPDQIGYDLLPNSDNPM